MTTIIYISTPPCLQRLANHNRCHLHRSPKTTVVKMGFNSEGQKTGKSGHEKLDFHCFVPRALNEPFV